MNLPTDIVEMEQAVREAIRAKLAGLADSGIVHGRERYADTLAKYLALFAVKDSAQGGKTVIAGALVKLLGPLPRLEDATSSRVPLTLKYGVEFIRQFEDTRKDGRNSSDIFNGVLMRAFDAFERDQTLGYEELQHKLLQPTEDASVEEFDTTTCHVAGFEIECEIER